jgi:prepilin-type N-terminal cleavage/methylation domain-containing protein
MGGITLPPGVPRPPRAEGFSLLEVLVATTIMGLVMVVLLQVLTAALRAQEASWSNTQAVLVGEKILQENCQVNVMTAGTYQGRDGRFDYLVKVAPQYELSDPFANKKILCSLIRVTLTWQEWGRRKTLDLQTIRTVSQKVM